MTPFKIAERTVVLELKKNDGDGYLPAPLHSARFSFLPDRWFTISKETYDELEKRVWERPLVLQLVIEEARR